MIWFIAICLTSDLVNYLLITSVLRPVLNSENARMVECVVKRMGTEDDIISTYAVTSGATDE